MKHYLPIFLILSSLLAIQACDQKASNKPLASPQASEEKTLYYTCPMHPQIHQDHKGKCPICGMDLVPVHEEKPLSPMNGPALPGHSKVYLSPEKQQMIGVKTSKVERRSIVREILAMGQMAYHPELFSAQQEYLIALKTVALQRGSSTAMEEIQSQFIEAARLRLLTLGMDEAQIRALRKQGRAEQSLILPQNKGHSWIYASTDESNLAWIHVGTPAKVFIPGGSEPLVAQVDSINPLIDRETRSAQIRISLAPSEILRPNLYLRIALQAESGSVLAVPAEAILDSGYQQTAFVALGEGNFEPRSVKIGQRGNDWVEVVSGLSLGESVVSSANFLIDSESRLKSAISGMGKPSHD